MPIAQPQRLSRKWFQAIIASARQAHYGDGLPLFGQHNPS